MRHRGLPPFGSEDLKFHDSAVPFRFVLAWPVQVFDRRRVLPPSTLVRSTQMS